MLNARIRKAWLKGAEVGLIGEAVDLTYDYHHVGTDRQALVDLAEADHAGAKDKRSVVIVGMGALREADGAAVLSQAMKLAEGSDSKLMVLHTAASPRGRAGRRCGDRGRHHRRHGRGRGCL